MNMQITKCFRSYRTALIIYEWPLGNICPAVLHAPERTIEYVRDELQHLLYGSASPAACVARAIN